MKGELIRLDNNGNLLDKIMFQYNPERISRRVEARIATTGDEETAALELNDPPQETITLTIELDDADSFKEEPQPRTSKTLAALMLLLHPYTASEVAQARGTHGPLQRRTPLTLFSWGKDAAVPVAVLGLSILEEAFTPALETTRARVELTMRVLSYADAKPDSKARDFYLTYLQTMEKLADDAKEQ